MYMSSTSLVHVFNITCTSLRHHLYMSSTSLVQVFDITCTCLRHHLYKSCTCKNQYYKRAFISSTSLYMIIQLKIYSKETYNVCVSLIYVIYANENIVGETTLTLISNKWKVHRHVWHYMSKAFTHMYTNLYITCICSCEGRASVNINKIIAFYMHKNLSNFRYFSKHACMHDSVGRSTSAFMEFSL